MDLLHSLGIIKTNGKTWDAMMSIFQKQAPEHKKVRELMPYSRFVQFVVQTRNFFMNEFAQCQADFPGIDGEALYLMSVFHSCDHASLLLAQSNWDFPGLPGNVDEEFLMAWEILVPGLVGLSDKILMAGLFYDWSTGGAPHPL